MHWSYVFSREWRCSWRCSNKTWVISKFIPASYIRDLTVVDAWLSLNMAGGVNLCDTNHHQWKFQSNTKTTNNNKSMNSNMLKFIKGRWQSCHGEIWQCNQNTSHWSEVTYNYHTVALCSIIQVTTKIWITFVFRYFIINVHSYRDDMWAEYLNKILCFPEITVLVSHSHCLGIQKWF